MDNPSKEPTVTYNEITEFVKSTLQAKPFLNPVDPEIIDYFVNDLTTQVNNGRGSDLEKLLEESIQKFTRGFNELIKAN